MGKLSGQKVTIGQANGPDIELIVRGDELYAHYETPAGYPVVYDHARGLFCYALLVKGRFHSSGVPATAAPPPAARRGGAESTSVRLARAGAREASRRPPADEREPPDKSAAQSPAASPRRIAPEKGTPP